MLLIANNITTRIHSVQKMLRQARSMGWRYDVLTGWNSQTPASIRLEELARRCAFARANMLEINIQQHYDIPEAMEFAINVVQQVTDLQLCLSTNNPEALKTGLRACRRPPLVNYISFDETKLREMLPLMAEYNAQLVLLVSEPAAPAGAREMLQKAAILIGVANQAGIPNDRIFVDPGLIHVTSDIGQRHLVEVMEFLRSLPEATEGPVKSTCWLSSSSAGAPRRLRPVIETTLLPMLAGAGLSSVFLDVLRPNNRQTVHLLRIFSNEVVYAESEIEL